MMICGCIAAVVADMLVPESRGRVGRLWLLIAALSVFILAGVVSQAYSQTFISQSDEMFTLPPGEYTVPARPGEAEHQYDGAGGERVNAGTYHSLVTLPALAGRLREYLPVLFGFALAVWAVWSLYRNAVRELGEPSPVVKSGRFVRFDCSGHDAVCETTQSRPRVDLDPLSAAPVAVGDTPQSTPEPSGSSQRKGDPDWRDRRAARASRSRERRNRFRGLVFALLLLGVAPVCRGASLTVSGLEGPQIRVEDVWLDPPSVHLSQVWPVLSIRDAQQLQWHLDLSSYSMPEFFSLDYLGSITLEGDLYGEFALRFPGASLHPHYAARQVPEPDLGARLWLCILTWCCVYGRWSHDRAARAGQGGVAHVQ